MSRADVLRFEKVRVRRGKRVLLDQLHGQVGQGEFLALVGENGCGKSSLLQVLAGLTDADSGQIWLAQTPLAKWQADDLSRRRAMMNQSAQIHFGFLTEDILLLGRSLCTETRQQSISLALRVSQWLDISHLFGRDVRTLSGGERQRVMLGKTLLQLFSPSCKEPEKADLSGRLLLLDEPTSALDYRHQKQVMGCLHQLCQQGLAVVCVSHDLNLILPYASTLYMLAEEHCIAVGPVKQVLTEDNLLRCFGTHLKLVDRPGQAPFITH